MRIMAIDYGDAHTGVALSDPTGFLVGSTTTINSWRQEVVVDRCGGASRAEGGEERQ